MTQQQLATSGDAVTAAVAGRPRLRVVYVGGWGRSGSTLLGRMLGELPDAVYVGEVRDIWQRGGIENRLCGCGAPFRDCPFWRMVGEGAFGGWHRVNYTHMLGLRARVDRPWALPWLARPTLAPRTFRAALDSYRDVLGALLAAIAEVGGCRTIVDTSKVPSFALLLAGLPHVDVEFVHIVRDSRASIYSWQRRTARHDSPGTTAYMIQYGALEAALRYLLYNTQSHAIVRSVAAYRFLRYEDLVTQPQPQLRLAAGGAETSDENAYAFVTDEALRLSPSHSVVGNPMRLEHGDVQLVPDRRWEREMSAASRAVVTAVTAPLLAAYGYLRR